MVVRMKCEGDWNSIHYCPSVTFVVHADSDQFVGHNDG